MAAVREILKVLSLPCREATQLISRAQDERLSWGLRAAIRVHTLYCGGCRRFKRQIEFLHAALRHAVESAEADGPTQLSAEARRRIQTALEDERTVS